MGEKTRVRISQACILAALVAVMMVAATRLQAVGPIACGDVLNGSSTYYLTADLYCTGPGPAITVVGPAKLRLNGFSVACEHGYDLEEKTADGRAVPKTVPTTEGSVGIELESSQAQLLGAGFHGAGAADPEDPTYRVPDGVVGCTTNVVLESGGRHIVQGVHSVQSVEAAFLIASNDNKLTGNTVRQEHVPTDISGDTDSFAPDGSPDPRPFRCQAVGFLVAGHRNYFYRNIAADCDENGFQVEEGQWNYFEGNIARDNEEYGFVLNDHENHLKVNSVLKNVTGGVLVNPAIKRTLIEYNAVSENGDGDEADGLEIRGNETTIRFNVVDHNWRFGISVYGLKNIITSNVVSRSDVEDLHDETASCGSGSNKYTTNVFSSANQACVK